MVRVLCFFFVAMSTTACFAQELAAHAIQAGEPVRYQPMYPERWKQKGTSTDLYPWEGKHIVVLTTTKDLDPKIMRLFVDRLDAGWELYGKIVKSPPINFGPDPWQSAGRNGAGYELHLRPGMWQRREYGY